MTEVKTTAKDFQALVAQAIQEALPHSDQRPEELVNCARHFMEAHRKRPGGISIEVGTRNGGSALLYLRLLEIMYGKDTPPFLTVDPYGGKPYQGGDVVHAHQLYSDENYLAMKKLLAPFPNHAHYHMTSETFFCFMRRHPFWLRGKVFFLGVNTTFVFLDGDHDHQSIRNDLDWVYPIHDPAGWDATLVLVDNVDKDPETIPLVSRDWVVEDQSSPFQLVVRGRRQ